jgi:hypothetical protein
MRLFIGLLRIVVGIAFLGLSGRVYLEHRHQLAGTRSIHVDFYGHGFESDPQLLVLGIGIGALIGVLALCAGLYAVTHWPESEREDDPPKAKGPTAAAPSDGAA